MISRVVLVALVLATFNAYSQTIKIDVLNGATREKRTYEGGAQQFEIPINFVKGWSRCTVMPLKQFSLYGVEKMRGEMYCRTTSGNTVGFSCAASNREMDVNIQILFGPNMKFADSKTISADSFAEITLKCDYV